MLVNCFSARRTTPLLLAVLLPAVLAVGAPATAAPTPKVKFVSNASDSSSSVVLPPDEPVMKNDADGGLLARTSAPATATSGYASATANAAQSSAVRHGPANVTGGYEMRRIRALSRVSGTADRGDEAGAAANVTATSQSETEFTITAPVALSLSLDTPAVQTDDSADCARTLVQLRSQTEVVYSRSAASQGCPRQPVNNSLAAEPLPAGTYRLTTLAEGNTTPSGTRVESKMRARVGVTLTLGSGRLCTNILPTSSGGTIEGTGGNDLLCGRSGPDVLKGFRGNDVLLGQGGSDVLYGAVGRDVLRPGNGTDRVSAGDGDDVVRACDNHKDTLRGQAGSDRVFRDRIDVISGFETKSTC